MSPTGEQQDTQPTLNQNKETYREKYFNSRGPQHPTIRNRQSTGAENQHRNKIFESHTQRVGPRRYI